MSSGTSGLGTSSQTFGANGSSSQNSQTSPYGAAVPALGNLISELQNYSGNGSVPTSQYSNLQPNEIANYQQAQNNVAQLPNFGPAEAQTASNILQTGGDPLGILRNEASNLNPIANENLNPMANPQMQGVLSQIQNDTENAVNSQFAGAGRSLSGLNEQTLARGLAQGEAVPLLNQYNQNVSNVMGADTGLTNVQNAAMGNIGNAFTYAGNAPGLASQNPLAQESIYQQEATQPYNYISAAENLINPIAGLGGTASGSQDTNQAGSGTATNSLLSQIGQGLGLLNPLGSFLGTL